MRPEPVFVALIRPQMFAGVPSDFCASSSQGKLDWLDGSLPPQSGPEHVAERASFKEAGM
jgi:hypothetical protein